MEHPPFALVCLAVLSAACQGQEVKPDRIARGEEGRALKEAWTYLAKQEKVDPEP